MERTELQRLYRAVLDGPPAEALQLGVIGRDPDATRHRGEIAEQLQQHNIEVHDSTYRSSGGLVDPDPPSPFGLRLVHRHRGDLDALFSDPASVADLVTELTVHLKYSAGSELVSDEDGQRWVFRPSILDSSAVARAVLSEAMASIADDARLGADQPLVPSWRDAPDWARQREVTMTSAEVAQWHNPSTPDHPASEHPVDIPTISPVGIRPAWEYVAPPTPPAGAGERTRRPYTPPPPGLPF